MKKKPKRKIVYLEDKGETIYSMAALNGLTPEEQEELDRRRKQPNLYSKGEKRAMLAAAFTVYGPILLSTVLAFLVTALLLYFFLK